MGWPPLDIVLGGEPATPLTYPVHLHSPLLPTHQNVAAFFLPFFAAVASFAETASSVC